MNTFTLEVWDDEARKVTFYSVRWEDAALCEMDKFLLRIGSMPGLKRPLQELVSLILDVIGNTHGAQPEFFNRFENRVTALPPKDSFEVSQIGLTYAGFPLRLYCLALSESVVVLFNGGVKNTRTVQESADSITVSFYEANEFAKRILAALYMKDIHIEGRIIVDYSGSTDMYL